jgi:phosphoglycerate dehydrogenase-like enzyme
MLNDTVVVASQLGELLDAQLRQLPGVRVLSIPRGAPTPLPEEVQVMFAYLFPGTQQEREASRPAGWPFKLQWVQLVSAGTDRYPRWLWEAPQVSSARGANAQPVAEFAVAAMFAAAKQLPSLWVQGPAQWKHTSLGMLNGATLGLVGFGAIGSAIAQKALALGMRVKASRRSATPFPLQGVEAATSLEELVAASDHLVLAAPATAETRHLIDAQVLSHAKPNLHLVNIARGTLVDQDALIAALDEGRVALATLDVTDPEPLPAGHPLYTHPKVRVSPHTAAISLYTQQALIDKFGRSLARVRAGQAPEDLTD